MSVSEYIRSFKSTWHSRNPQQLQQLLTINPGANNGLLRAKFHEPSDFDLYEIEDKFHPVIRMYLRVMRSIYLDSNIRKAFIDMNEFVMLLNRAAEVHNNWVCPALINLSNELILIHTVRSRSYSDQLEHPVRSTESSLELVASTINRLFKICLTDKSPETAMLKKQSIHFFLAALIKIYFRLNRLELARSMEKALVGTKLALPTIVNSPPHYRRHVVTYLYYSSLLSLDDGDWAFAETKLLAAMEFLLCYAKPNKVRGQAELILSVLIPLKYLNSQTSLPAKEWQKFPSLDLLYRRNLLHAVRIGNLKLFDESVARFRKILLRRHIYVAFVHLRTLCELQVFKAAVMAYALLETTTPHIVPFSAFQLAMDLSQGESRDNSPANEYSTSVEKVECLLANLIAGKRIKGYLSHGNRCIVLLKTDAFPKH